MKKIYLLLPLMALFMACQSEVKPTKVQSKTLELTTQDDTLHLSIGASLQGQQDVEIIPQVSGTLLEIKVKPGQMVSKGQAMFVVDQVPSLAELRVAQADVKVAQASAATAKMNLASKQDLKNKNIISDIQVKKAENEYATALAAIDQAEARVTNAKQSLSFTVIKAPCDGMVGDIPYRVGALVGPTIATPLTTVSNNDNIYANFFCTEGDLLKLNEEYGGLTAADALKMLPKVQLRTSIGTIYSELGTVVSISGVINRSTGTMSARAIFPNTKHVLRSGGTGEVIFPFAIKDAIIIPQSATRTMQDQILAYKVVDNKAKSVAVKVVPTDDNLNYIVTEGLKAGDVIIADGAGNVVEGEEVNFELKME